MKKFITHAMIYVALASNILTACPHDTDTIITIESSNDLENLLQKNQGPCVLYMYMQGCDWCKKMSSIISTLSEDNDFCDTVTFYQTDGPKTQADQLIQSYCNKNLQGYPTILLMNQGTLFDMQIGATSQAKMKQKLTALLNTGSKQYVQ